MEKVFLLRGHGSYLKGRSFRLGSGQYVIFPSMCGLPGEKKTMIHPEVLKLLRDPVKLLKFAKGELPSNLKNSLPITFKNPILLGPGDLVSDHILEMKDEYDPLYHMSSGKWYIGKTTAEDRYLGGRGRKITLGSFVKSHPTGVFIFDGCRVSLGTTMEEATKKIIKIVEGARPFPLIDDSYARDVAIYEQSMKRLRNFKRKRVSPSLTLRRDRTREDVVKKAKLTGSVNVVAARMSVNKKEPIATRKRKLERPSKDIRPSKRLKLNLLSSARMNVNKKEPSASRKRKLQRPSKDIRPSKRLKLNLLV